MHNAINTTLEINASNAGMLFDIINLAYSRRGITPYPSRSRLISAMAVSTRSGSVNLMKNNEAFPVCPVISCAVFNEMNNLAPFPCSTTPHTLNLWFTSSTVSPTVTPLALA